MSVVAFFLAAALVQNVAFEELDGSRPIGWQLPSKHYSVVKGEGQNGSGGLVWENDDPTFYQWPYQSVMLEVGKVYRIGARIKVDELKGVRKGVFVLLEWYDKNGKWLGGRYTPHLKAEKTDDWITHETVTQPIPEGAVEFRFGVAAAKTSTGRVRFDNVYVMPFERPVVAGVYPSVYRGTAASGSVMFCAALNEPANGWPAGMEVKFNCLNADGKPQIFSAQRVSKDSAAIPLKVSDLPLGESKVGCRVVTADGRELGRAETVFVREREMKTRTVAIDAQGRTLVNGRPFFPLGMYFDKVTADELDVYTNGPFNCVLPYSPPRNRELDLCRERGLMCCYSIKGAVPGSLWAQNRKLKNQAEVSEHVRKLMRPVQNHPALLAWYVNDEAPLTQLGGLVELQRTIQAQDPEHPTFAVMDRSYDLRDFLPSFDVIGFDPYPVAQRPIGQVAEFAKAFRKATFARPMWAVPQAFDWGWFRPQEKGKERMPSAEEMTSMSFQAIAGGANGIIYYAFYVYRKPSCDLPFEECFSRAVKAARAVKEYERIYLLDPRGPKVRPSDQRLVARSWRDADGSAWVLVVNTTRETVEASINVSGNWLNANGGSVPISLKPIGYQMIHLENSGGGPTTCDVFARKHPSH